MTATLQTRSIGYYIERFEANHDGVNVLQKCPEEHYNTDPNIVEPIDGKNPYSIYKNNNIDLNAAREYYHTEPGEFKIKYKGEPIYSATFFLTGVPYY